MKSNGAVFRHYSPVTHYSEKDHILCINKHEIDESEVGTELKLYQTKVSIWLAIRSRIVPVVRKRLLVR